MKTSSTIEVISKIAVPVKEIEKYINTNINRTRNKTRKGTGFNLFSHAYEKIDCASAYADLEGTVEIFFRDGRRDNFRSINVTTSTRYFCTCAKGKGKLYKVAWATSLS
jgi:hypothetical protein